MILLDKALWHGLRFVLENIGRAAETEMDDAPRLREHLMDAQLRFEAGELSADELAEIETQTLARLRALDARGDRKQAVRRMQDGTLSDAEIESIGVALEQLERTIHELAADFGLSPEDLNLDLGPLGPLI